MELSFQVLPLTMRHPLRLTLYAMLLLAVKFYLILVLDSSATLSIRPIPELFWLTVAMSLLAFWRTEGFVFLLLLPFVIWRFKYFDISTKAFQKIVSLVACIFTFVLFFEINKAQSNPQYTVAAVISPLSVMLQGDLGDNPRSDDLLALDEYLNIDVIKENPNPLNIDSFWMGAIRGEFEDLDVNVLRLFLRLVHAYPRDFIESRV